MNPTEAQYYEALGLPIPDAGEQVQEPAEECEWFSPSLLIPLIEGWSRSKELNALGIGIDYCMDSLWRVEYIAI